MVRVCLQEDVDPLFRESLDGRFQVRGPGRIDRASFVRHGSWQNVGQMGQVAQHRHSISLRCVSNPDVGSNQLGYQSGEVCEFDTSRVRYSHALVLNVAEPVLESCLSDAILVVYVPKPWILLRFRRWVRTQKCNLIRIRCTYLFLPKINGVHTAPSHIHPKRTQGFTTRCVPSFAGGGL